MGTLSVRVLGELTVDGIDLSQLDRKARTLLQLLALARGRAVPGATLADALWGDRPPARPGDQLAVLASRLRRVLGRDRVEHSDAGYRLRADWLDLVELEAVVAEAERREAAGEAGGAVAAARIGLALLRGALPDVSPGSTWVSAERAAAERLVVRARRVAATALLGAGQWQDALEIAAADSGADPYDEHAVRTVMRAHVAAGRPARALATYATLREVLAEELGADPAPETEELHTSILRGDTPVATTAALGPSLVGRTSQAAHLDALALRVAAESVPRAALVNGEAGIGKTTLLTAWAAARRALGDRVLVGTCGALDRAAPLDVVLSTIGDHLRGRPEADAVLGDDRGMLAPLLGLTAGDGPQPRATDPSLGPSLLYAAVANVLARIGAGDRVVLVVDDAHLAGQPLADWLAFVLRRPLPLLVVLGARPHDGPSLPVTDEVALGPLDLAQVAEVVGTDRAADLFRRSGGHPLFLAELAAAPGDALPRSLVAAVTTRCDQLGAAGELVRAAAVLGGVLDVELLAVVLGRRALEVLADVEEAVRQGLLVEDAGRHRFRHELVREALVSGTTPGRAALLHRAAGQALAQRPEADPVAVADHARRGGDPALAAAALRRAAARAAERFDHATAEDLLDQSLSLHADDHTRVARARVRTRRRRYAEAEDDALAAATAGAERWETAAWAAYFDRRFDDALRYAEDGMLAADPDDPTRVRCLVASGRILHARGDLAAAATRIDEALSSLRGEDRIAAAAWLGVINVHRGDVDEALRLLRPATRPGLGVDHTSATLHAQLFTGHALAVAGRPADALACFERYTSEVERRDVPRFAGRGLNFGGWVLRNVGATGAGREAHQQAAEMGGEAILELRVAACEDLADAQLRENDPDAAAVLLDSVRPLIAGDLVFGWRLRMKLQLLDARARLAVGDPEGALRVADELARTARQADVRRYASCGRLVHLWSAAASGERVDPEDAWRACAAVEQSVGVEAWWWAGATGAALGMDRCLRRAEELADGLARRSGPHADTLRLEAGRRLAQWRAGLSAR